MNFIVNLNNPKAKDRLALRSHWVAALGSRIRYGMTQLYFTVIPAHARAGTDGKAGILKHGIGSHYGLTGRRFTIPHRVRNDANIFTVIPAKAGIIKHGIGNAL